MRAFSTADDSNRVALIENAKRRLVFVAPAVSPPVAQALSRAIQRLGPDGVTLTLDVSADTYRLGYGEASTLQSLYDATRSAGQPLRMHAGLRIGVLISDDTMMVYAPTPLLIEAGSKQDERPNAVLVGMPTDEVLRELGLGPEGVKDQKVGLDLATQFQIHGTPPG